MSSFPVAPTAAPDVVQARPATKEDVPGLSATLAAAFIDDPVFSWCFADAARRQDILPHWFEAVIAANLVHGEIYTTDDVVAGAVWLPPHVEDDEQLGEALGQISGEYAGNLFRAFELMDQHHPREPHHYLFLLGTRHEFQSRGIGSALMAPVLEVCDREALPAYLEATSERNMHLYLRRGFQLCGEINLPGGPTMWPMWREPRTAGSRHNPEAS